MRWILFLKLHVDRKHRLLKSIEDEAQDKKYFKLFITC